MTARRMFLAGLLAVAGLSWGVAQEDASRRPDRGDRPVPLVEDPAKAIDRYLEDGWVSPERRRWRIEYRPIDGMSSHSEWHLEGTHWWVRLYPEEEMPEHYRLASFDKTAVYEIDGVALHQAYGTIKFWVYGRPKKLTR